MKAKKITLQVIVLVLLTGNMIYAQSIFPDSKVPKAKYSNTLEKQLKELEKDSLMIRFAESRKKMKDDPYRPLYHFVNPESNMHDANGLCFWQGRWHIFYQAFPPDGEKRVHWGHAVSDDLIHWKDLPYAMYPGPEKSAYSGSTLVEDNRVIAMYHGFQLGNIVAVADDPLLLNWEKIAAPAPALTNTTKDGTPRPYYIFDPCIWKEGDTYYSITGGGRTNNGPGGSLNRANYLFKSTDLINWDYMHEFITDADKFTIIGEDAACPYFWPIGEQHILTYFSHIRGGHYMLGDYNKQENKFHATAHGKFNFQSWGPGGVHAPSSTPDGKGGVIVIFNMNQGKPVQGWNQMLTLPRRLTSVTKDELKIEPAGDIESLRYDHVIIPKQNLPANQEVELTKVRGKAMELQLQINPMKAQTIQLNVLQSENKKEYTSIKIFTQRGHHLPRLDAAKKGYQTLISLETDNSSILPDARSRAPEVAPIELAPDEMINLRVFIDKSIVEVFVNEKQALAARVYPGLADSDRVSLTAKGSDAVLLNLDAWQMKSIYK